MDNNELEHQKLFICKLFSIKIEEDFKEAEDLHEETEMEELRMAHGWGRGYEHLILQRVILINGKNASLQPTEIHKDEQILEGSIKQVNVMMLPSVKADLTLKYIGRFN